MELELLIATMRQKNFSKFLEMNIQSDVVFTNQSGENRVDQTEIDGHHVKMITTNTVGVGKNRNIGLLYTTGDVLLFGDDDVRYIDGYREKVLQLFQDFPKADAMLFNLSKKSGQKMIRKVGKVGIHNFMRYGTVRLAVRREALFKANIWFSILYGGGAEISCGEDTLFLREMLKKRLKIFSHPYIIGELTDNRPSTWFTGDYDKLFHDRGYLIANAFPMACYLFQFYFAYKFKRIYKVKFFHILTCFRQGISDFKSDKRH